MNPDTLYLVFNLGILPAWLSLILAPRWWLTRRAVLSGAYSVIYAVLYGILVVTAAAGDVTLDFNSFAAVSRLFDQPLLLLAGWVHYLAFDLLVGAWIVKDGQERQLPHWWLAPVLIMTLYFGPLGYLLYRILTAVTGSRWRKAGVP